MSSTTVTEGDIDRLYADGEITDFECALLHLIRDLKEKGYFEGEPGPDALKVCFIGRVEREGGR